MHYPKRLFIPSGINTKAQLGPKLAKHADKYNYLLHYLISAQAFDKRLSPESYIPVNTRYFEKYVTANHVAPIFSFWITQGVVERQPKPLGRAGYVVGKKSIGYRLTADYATRRVIDVGYIDDKFEAKVDKITKEFREGKMDMTVDSNAFIFFNLRELRINAVAAHQRINKLLTTGTYSLKRANSATVKVQSIREGNWFCLRDMKGHRIHNNWCTLNKNLRQDCFIETGEQLVNIDVRNSQPVILAILLRQRFTIDTLTPDVLHYIELCEEGLLYEHLAAKFGIDITDDDARTAFKKMLFKTIFYGHNEAAKKYAEWTCFQDEFPTVAAFITEYKRYDYTALSIALQRLESEIMIEGVIATIASQHNPEDFFALTIHDSITTTVSNQEFVLGLLREEFAMRGIKPSFVTDYLN